MYLDAHVRVLGHLGLAHVHAHAYPDLDTVGPGLIRQQPLTLGSP